MRTIMASGLSIIFDGEVLEGNDTEQTKRMLELANLALQRDVEGCPQFAITSDSEGLEISSQTWS